MSEIVKLDSAVGLLNGATAEEVRDKLAQWGDADAEAAHGWEDWFARDVLRAIAQGHPNPTVLASEALVVLDADYGRWFA